MDVALLVQRPLYCGRRRSAAVSDRTKLVRIKAFSALPFHRRINSSSSSQSSLWCEQNYGIEVSNRVVASADFSKRRPRKSQVSRPTPRGFAPKQPVSIQKRDRTDDSVGGNDSSSSTSTYTDYGVSDEKLNKLTVDNGEEQGVRFSLRSKEKEKIDRTLSANKQSVVRRGNDTEDNGKISNVLEDKTESEEEELVSEDGAADEAKPRVLGRKWSDVIKGDEAEERVASFENYVDTSEIELEKLEISGLTDLEESFLKPKVEIDAHARKQLLESLAEENVSRRNKVFVYPQVVKPGEEIEVFLNRSISNLKNESEVFIMGAFNDWRWKSFTIKLSKTELKGDWWSCHVYVPLEAYKMDFVFFNGGSVYENNDKKDYCVLVEGRMDAFAFEDFLLEEKHRELQKLAAEQAERERQEEERRLIEAEKVAIESDRQKARLEVEKRREKLQGAVKNALRFVDNMWHFEPGEFKGEDLVRLYYNRSSGPLANASEIWIHGGHNNWSNDVSFSGRLVRDERKDGEWWYAHVIVPSGAFVLDWVFANGPPGSATLYDNNQRQDFHAVVPNAIPEEMYWVEEEHRMFRKLQEERKMQEQARLAKAEKIVKMKAETKKRTMKKFLLSQKHIVYTDPLDIQAGSSVTVFYNPSNTVLNGKPEVWFRCSFNRWTHRNGPLPPQKMLLADSGSHFKVTVKVPLDAYMMDFVFSENQDGGIYDNRNGMDYHIPVFGGVAKEPPMHIVHVAVEMAPIAKVGYKLPGSDFCVIFCKCAKTCKTVGGLGDVVTSLSRAVVDLGHNVDIILPKYDCLNLSNVKNLQFHRSYSWGGTEIKVWTGKVEGLTVYFLEPQNGLFWKGCIYGCGNDGERFGFFCHAALEFLLQSGVHPDILHCHDWSSAPVAWLFKDHYMHYGLSKTRVVFTIHNLEFGAHLIGKAIQFSDKATTVSHTYSKEVSGNTAISPHLHKFHGIVNGIDPDIWDPYNDKVIPVCYTSENVVDGKRAAKEALQRRLGLDLSDKPLVGIITRLTFQKGIHLIKHAIGRTLDRGGQVVLLGSAPDPRIQNDFVDIANHLHNARAKSARLCLAYDEPLSHLIYAGADIILVPSIFEPCGLTQLIAMRYGSIPVVRKTGGLYDTVFDVDHDKERAQAIGLEPNGFSFDGADSAGVDYALNRAITAWYDNRDWFNSLCKQVMEQDWSWNRPALDYIELYYAARK